MARTLLGLIWTFGPDISMAPFREMLVEEHNPPSLMAMAVVGFRIGFESPTAMKIEPSGLWINPVTVFCATSAVVPAKFVTIGKRPRILGSIVPLAPVARSNDT